MTRQRWRALVSLLLPAGLAVPGYGQRALSWQEVRERFEKNNPNLIAARVGIEESRANEVTAGLRPNPVFSTLNEQFNVFGNAPLQPFQNTQLTQTVSQLWERRHKRPLRVESARVATSIVTSDLADLARQLTFALRDAFVRVLQAKSLLELAESNLAYYDKVIAINRTRLKAGDISRVDLSRVELQRVQYESDLESARVNLRTAKIQLLALMNERQPVDAFDVTGPFDFGESLVTVEEARRAALDARPDLFSARRSIEKAQVDNRLAWANGSWDPILGMEYQRTGPDNTLGFGVTIPLRIFDKNQGEKARTELEITRAGRVAEGIEIGVLRDVDSAFAQVESVRALLRPYRDRYLKQAADVRETVSFAYLNGGASLLEFLDAQKAYRDAQLAYRNLIGSYLAAVNQLNLAAAKEIIP